MNIYRLIQICLATTGILNFLLVAVLLIVNNKGNFRANRLLGVLLISVCLKLSFGILINIKHEWGFLSFMINGLSIAAYLSFGPLLYIYYKLLFHEKIKYVYASLFFVPLCTPLFELILNFRTPVWFAQLYFAIFLFVIFFQYRNLPKQKKHTGMYATQKKWAYIIYLSFLSVWATANLLIIDIHYYFIELLAFIITLLYFDIYWAVKHYWMKKGEQQEVPRTKIQKLNTVEVTEIINKLKKLMEKEKLYIDPELTLPKVASLLNLKVYKISYVINQAMGMTFNEYVNSYRIKDITKALASPDNQNVKILSIAFDFGFNSISVFNNSFKKITNYTPTEYRNKYLLSDTN